MRQVRVCLRRRIHAYETRNPSLNVDVLRAWVALTGGAPVTLIR